MKLIDSHAHLNFPGFKSLDFPDVDKIIVVGTNLDDSEKAVALRSDKLFPTVGIHPHESNQDWGKFKELAKQAVAIGECGLDFSKIENEKLKEERSRQFGLLARQIKIAEEANLPLVLHIRDAQEDIVSHFGHQLANLRGVFHCFSGDENYLHTILKLMPGFFVSFAGNITFKNASDLRELARMTPLERLLVETDCPFLAPEPGRGTRNSPENVKIVAEKIAEVKGLSLERVAQATVKNTENLFRI